MCPLASWEAKQAAPSDALVPGSWQCSTHDEAVAQAFEANAPKRRRLFAICAKQAMHLRVLSPTERVNRLYHATLWCLGAGNASQTQLNVTFALSRLVHPHSDACVQTVLPRSCIYLSPCLLGGRTGCTMRCFRAWELAMHHAQRSSSTSLNSGLMHPNDDACVQSICPHQRGWHGETTGYDCACSMAKSVDRLP